jgi:hypothetical protein
MIDRFTDHLFWPALIGSWIGVAVSSAALVVRKWVAELVLPTTLALALLAALMFVMIVIDGPTRRAIMSYRFEPTAEWIKLDWLQRLFSPELGDRRLLIVNRFSFPVFLIAVFSGSQTLIPLSFVSFGLSAMMLLLMLKRISRTQLSPKPQAGA